MRYLLSLIFVFAFNAFSACNLPMIFDYKSVIESYWASDMGSPPTPEPTCSEITTWENGFVEPSGRILLNRIVSYYHTASSCPTGQAPDVNGVCTDLPPPSTCSWATTPPWIAGGSDQSICYPHRVSSPTLSTAYIDNQKWCSNDNTCYGLPYYCPAGKYFWLGECKNPDTTPDSRCPLGYYTKSGTDSDGVCWIEKVCKTNPSIRVRWAVSCGSGPVLPETPDFPNAPEPDTVPSAKPYQNATSECSAKQNLAKIMCQSPKVFSFSCDPTTGTVIKSECKDPVTPITNPTNTGDDTKAATTQDIKDLGNNLPESLKKAFNDFFNEGSMPRLEQLRGHLEAENILSADRNDKLDTLTASADAGLVLQSDANDNLKSIEATLKDGKTSQEFTGFIDKNNFQDSNDASNKGVLEDIKDFANTVVSDATSISNQFDTAKSSIQNGFQPVSLPSGGCSDISFNIPGSNVPNTIPLSRVPSVISPYSPIFSLLVYMTVMFFIFKFLFLFFISRSK